MESFSTTIQNSRTAQSKACYHADILRVSLGGIRILISCHLCVIKNTKLLAISEL